jgi:hypothetical protein
MGILASYIYFPPYWLPMITPAVEANAPTLQGITDKESIEVLCDNIVSGKQILTPEALKDYISCQSDIYGYEWDINIAYEISYCESRGNILAHNYSDLTRDDSWSLFQINRYGNLANVRPSVEWLIIPKNTIAYAYKIYQLEGWYAWRNCFQA